jgi:cell division protein FtsW
MMMRTYNIPLILFTLALILTSIGILSVYSASPGMVPDYAVKQMGFAGLGLAAMMIFYHLDYRLFQKLGFWIMLAALIGCFLVYVPGIASPAKGAHRWIEAGPFRFQPSEFAKLALVIYMAKMLSERRPYIRSFFSGVLPAMMITGVFAVVIVMEPDFGATLVLCLVVFGMWLAAEMRWFHLLGLFMASIPAGAIFFLMEPYRWKRLIAFISNDPALRFEAGFQLWQSKIAVGSGGLWGVGLGQSIQKFRYVSESHTDFIFAIMCEELGFVRITVLVILLGLLVMLGWRVALRTSDLFGSLLACGITLMLFIGITFNMGVVLGLLPTKGLVLPLVSAGGSSLIVSMAAIGMLMNVARTSCTHDAGSSTRKTKSRKRW